MVRFPLKTFSLTQLRRASLLISILLAELFKVVLLVAHGFSLLHFDLHSELLRGVRRPKLNERRHGGLQKCRRVVSIRICYCVVESPFVNGLLTQELPLLMLLLLN